MEKVAKHVEVGMRYGLIQPGYDIDEYLGDAVIDPSGFECAVIHGQQSAGKSNFALQRAFAVLFAYLLHTNGKRPTEREVWNAVLDCIVFLPSDFIKKLEAIDQDVEPRLPIVIWDDIQLDYTSSAFRIDIQQYAAVDSMFAVIRTKVAVVLITIPNITRLPKNVKDNVTFEMFIGKNRRAQIRRVYRLPGTRYINSNLFKPIIQESFLFNLFDIPPWVWVRYEAMRKEIGDRALANLKGVTDMEEVEGYIPITEAVKIVKDNGVKWGIQTVQQLASRRILQKQMINGEMCINEEHLMSVIKAETYKPGQSDS